MIQIITQPKGIILDSNLNQIEVNSDSNEKLSLDTNNHLLNQITVAKYNKTNAIIHLKHLYRNVAITKTEIKPKLYKVNNVFDISGRIKSESNEEETIQPFQILYSVKTIEQLPILPISFLGIAESLLYSSNCKLTIPFFITQEQSLVLRVFDQKKNQIDVIFIGKIAPGYYIYENNFNLNYNVEALTIELAGDTVIQKQVRILKNKANKALNIRFVNQFGATIYCQLFSNVQIEEELKPKIFKNQNGRQFTTEIESDSTITLDTGYLLNSELFLVKQLLNSLSIELELNGRYTPVVSSTKKVTLFKNREFITVNKLIFTHSNYEAY